MKKLLSLLIITATLATPAYAMEQTNTGNINPNCSPQNKINPIYLVDFPEDVIKHLFSLNLDTQAPWELIKTLQALSLTCKDFQAMFPNIEAFVANLHNIPLMHAYAATGNITKMLELKTNHNNQANCSFNGLDRFGFSPIDYATGNKKRNVIEFLQAFEHNAIHQISVGKNAWDCLSIEDINPGSSPQNAVEQKPDPLSFKERNVIEFLQAFEHNAIHQTSVEKNAWDCLSIDPNNFPQALANLIQSGGNINALYNYSDQTEQLKVSLLHKAVFTNNLACTQALLENNTIDINIKGTNDVTPLHLATLYGHLDWLQALIALDNIDINAKDNKGWTPLHIAAFYGRLNWLQALISRGNIDINTKNYNGDTPLHLAASFGHESCLNALIALDNIDINTKNYNGDTPLHLATEKGQLTCLQTLIALNNININIKNNDDLTPLHFAASYGHLTCLNALLNAKTHVDAKNNDGEIPLHYAASFGHETCLEPLAGQDACLINMQINSDITADECNYGLYTPLHFAAKKGHLSCVTKLVELGADVTLKNQDGKTARDLAQDAGHKDISEFLEKKEDEEMAFTMSQLNT